MLTPQIFLEKACRLRPARSQKQFHGHDSNWSDLAVCKELLERLFDPRIPAGDRA
jgi:hypothetical protein